MLVSSAGANAKSRFFYSRMKGQLEADILPLHFKKIEILRPSLLMGDRAEKRTGEKIAQKVFPLLTRFIFKKYKPIAAATVAKAMIKSVNQAEGQHMYELDEIFELADA